MALIKCPECQKEVSDKSEKCIHCGFPLNKQSRINPSYKINKWPCKVCGNMINQTPCPYCTSSTGDNLNSNITGFNVKTNKSSKLKTFRNNLLSILLITVVSIVVIILGAAAVAGSIPKYYVAKMPNYSAGELKVDGYMHKSKSCCEKVATHFGATVIEIKAGDEAGKNEYGQSIKYKDAFNYCPLCCD